ncbi:large ribosomal subunit protein uL29c [Aristolochia californica]|uniref:large ribosomal subunit protein uL29c n=1 Tax=Aristolochia californica TaxID=171875 RepID=UPI0035DCA06C
MLGLLYVAPPSSISLSSSKNITSIQKSSFHGARIQQVCPLRIPSLRKNAPVASVVMMAKREEELTEIRAKTTEEINEEVIDLKGELFMLRLQKSARNEFKSSEFGRMRKRVARLLTVKREREIEQGIGKRLSRKLDRKWKRGIVVRPPPSLRKMQEEEKAAEAGKSA